MEIYYDSLQEGQWFQGLHPSFAGLPLVPINQIVVGTPIAKVLEYDRPDIILADGGEPILVIERTVEVPTGHNVGQRFARLAAAAEARVPVVYFGPYMAKKHGGVTAGPRYMNLRLFYALDSVAKVNATAVTTINWPVDASYELLRTAAKDEHMKAYIALFLKEYGEHGSAGLSAAIQGSKLHRLLDQEKKDFIAKYVRAPAEYDVPPPSVEILSVAAFTKATGFKDPILKKFREVVLYDVGMTYVRSDPYTGTAMLYHYLYVQGVPSKRRALILRFPNITKALWDTACKSGARKDVRLYKHVADVILLKDGVWVRGA